ncbi:MAG: ABC transporter permease [Candidatus Korarchaeum sp.]|nr:ABC transporter permease [Candidatus Korarchaeum sp.]MDW8035864.1 ABC transporter permease [Candidatus Korarchaeum sp.]
MQLLSYATKRILIGFFIVLFVLSVLFIFMQLLPGDPITLLTAGQRVSPERVEELKRAWGLDQPIYVQFFYWLSRMLQGDFGTSFVFKLPVSRVVIPRIPATLQLTVTALVLSYILGMILGLISAVRRGYVTEKVSTGIYVTLYSIPTYWLGAMLMLIFGFQLRMLPISGYGTPAHLVLPVMTLALPNIAIFARMMRTEVLEVLYEDYVRTAMAKGLPKSVVLFRHVMRNSLIPVTVLFFLELPWTMGGAVIVEAIFSWPGIGNLLYRSILMQDFPVVMFIIFIISVLTVISNLVGDLLTAILDPRVSLKG